MKHYQGCFCKAAEAILKYHGRNRKGRINEETWQVGRKEPRSELNYLIQNLKGFENKSKRISMPKIKLRRTQDDKREPSLINWQRRQKRPPTKMIWVCWTK